MTRDEVKKILIIMTNTYPNFKPADMKITIDIWFKMLEDMSYQKIENALITYIRTDVSGFAPTIGQLMSASVLVHEDLSEMEAWALVSRALRNGTYGAEEEFNKLPKDVQRCVGSPDMLRHWAQTETKSVENVIQSNFLRSYRAVKERSKELSKLPASMLLQEKEKVLIGGKQE